MIKILLETFDLFLLTQSTDNVIFIFIIVNIERISIEHSLIDKHEIFPPLGWRPRGCQWNNAEVGSMTKVTPSIDKIVGTKLTLVEGTTLPATHVLGPCISGIVPTRC